MVQQRMTIRLGLLFFLIGSTMAWSKRTHKPGGHHSHIAAAESKVETRYSNEPKASESAYPLDGGYPYPKAPGHSEEYVDSEDHKSVKEDDEAQGNSELDDSAKSDEYDEHSEKGGHKEFKAGGFSFDKHLKDHKADNKEVENVKLHDIGEKFGGEITKEHKLGKHKEKSKGHKLHGFKNVYHKEEYGDHKTFHDEFLDTDHQHNYDDHHEHQEVEGGKFSKGFKNEGKNVKYDKGDEKHEWGKEEFDIHGEGKHDKGGNKSKHRHAVKKHQGHYDANAHREKNSVHKIKHGSPPPYVHHAGHHGPHQAQIEPFVPHYNSYQEQIDIPLDNYNPPIDPQSHQVPYNGDNYNGNGVHGNHYQSNADHQNNHGSQQHIHGGQYENGHNDQFYANNGGQDDYHERTAQNPQQRSSGKEILEDKSDEKFVPNIKEEQVTRKHDPIEQKHEAVVQTHEPVLYKTQPIVHRQDPIVQKHEPRSHKHHLTHAHNHQSHAHNHQPHAHNHQSRAYNHQSHAHNHQSHPHKHSFTPRHEIKHHRKPVYQGNIQLRSSIPAGYEKFSQPFNERFDNNNHRVRYRFQPHNHQQHNHNRRVQHNSNYHHQQKEHQSSPRLAGFNHHHQSHGHHHQQSHGLHHHGSNKNNSNFRHMPNNHQPAYRSDAHIPKTEQMPIKPSKSEDQHIVSQKRYE